MKAVVLYAVLGVFLSPWSALSDEVTYVYTGPKFTLHYGFPGPDHITGSLTLAETLPSNFSGNISPLAYSFTAIGFTWTELNSAFSGVVQTDADGAFAYWSIGASESNPPPDPFGVLHPYSFWTIWESADQHDQASCMDCGWGQAIEFGARGTWSTDEEPSSLLMLGVGLVCIVGGALSRKRVCSIYPAPKRCS